MPRSSRQAFHRLHALAHSQGGYFTAKQAAELGYGYPHLTYHVGAGNFERAGHGIYRLVTVPLSEHDDLVRLSLWSRDRSDQPQAVVSHASALVLHGLSDLLPGAIHLTVPRRFQKTALPVCVLHRGELAAHEIEARDGFRVTTPLQTLVDVAAATDVSQDDLNLAVRDALGRGLVRGDALRDAVGRSARVARTRFSLALAAVRGVAA